jgi:Putative Mg2+ and Co2+ transporter CorB
MTFSTALAAFADHWLSIVAILALVGLSAFCTGAKTALTFVSRSRMHSLESSGNARASLVNRLVEGRERLTGTLRLGANLAIVGAAVISAGLAAAAFGMSGGVLVAAAAVALFLAVSTEVVARVWAAARADRFALAAAPLANLIVTVLEPFAAAADSAAAAVLSLFGVRLSSDEPLLPAHEEIRGAVDLLHREGSVVKAERDRLGGVLDLGELEVSDVMIHRTGMRMINADDPVDANVRAILDSPFTRLPIWRRTTDNIIGIVHAKDVLRALADAGNDASAIDIVRIAQKPWFVPDTTSVPDQLNAFLRRKAHIAIVVDEYGELQGLVTLEDILEEIVGDITDEHDIDVQGLRQEADGSIVVDGSVPIRDLNRALDWNLPDDEATTIAGLVIHESQVIPAEKQSFTFHGKRFIVMKREKNRITRLRIRPAERV